MRPLEFGWYLPTHGDTTAYGLVEAQIAGSPELCDRVVQAAEQAGFEYLLIPVGSTCWEAWISGAFMAARSRTIKPLIAARPGYINPVLMAKMISTFDQMSGGRICINLIAGQNESEVEGEGVRYPKEERYALMEEEVSILKALWTTRGPVHFAGQVSQAVRRAYPAAAAAAAVSKILSRRRLAPGLGIVGETFRRASVLGRPAGKDRVRTSPRSGRWRARMAARTTSASACGCRSSAARTRRTPGRPPINWCGTPPSGRSRRSQTLYNNSEANQRVQQLAREHGDLLLPHLWTGITKVRPGAGIAVVGNPAQCADTLQQFIDAGCHSFCLSGYLHDEEAERFGRLIRPILAENNRGRWAA